MPTLGYPAGVVLNLANKEPQAAFDEDEESTLESCELTTGLYGTKQQPIRDAEERTRNTSLKQRRKPVLTGKGSKRSIGRMVDNGIKDPFNIHAHNPESKKNFEELLSHCESVQEYGGSSMS